MIESPTPFLMYVHIGAYVAFALITYTKLLRLIKHHFPNLPIDATDRTASAIFAVFWPVAWPSIGLAEFCISFPRTGRGR
jgi:hypothetical protein